MLLPDVGRGQGRDGQSMYTDLEFVCEHRIHPSLAFNFGEAAEGVRDDANVEMRLAFRFRAGMPRMLPTLVCDNEFGWSKRSGEFLPDRVGNEHAQVCQ